MSRFQPGPFLQGSSAASISLSDALPANARGPVNTSTATNAGAKADNVVSLNLELPPYLASHPDLTSYTFSSPPQQKGGAWSANLTFVWRDGNVSNVDHVPLKAA